MLPPAIYVVISFHYFDRQSQLPFSSCPFPFLSSNSCPPHLNLIAALFSGAGEYEVDHLIPCRYGRLDKSQARSSRRVNNLGLLGFHRTSLIVKRGRLSELISASFWGPSLWEKGKESDGLSPNLLDRETWPPVGADLSFFLRTVIVGERKREWGRDSWTKASDRGRWMEVRFFNPWLAYWTRWR